MDNKCNKLKQIHKSSRTVEPPNLQASSSLDQSHSLHSDGAILRKELAAAASQSGSNKLPLILESHINYIHQLMRCLQLSSESDLLSQRLIDNMKMSADVEPMLSKQQQRQEMVFASESQQSEIYQPIRRRAVPIQVNDDNDQIDSYTYQSIKSPTQHEVSNEQQIIDQTNQNQNQRIHLARNQEQYNQNINQGDPAHQGLSMSDNISPLQESHFSFKDACSRSQKRMKSALKLGQLIVCSQGLQKDQMPLNHQQVDDEPGAPPNQLNKILFECWKHYDSTSKCQINMQDILVTQLQQSQEQQNEQKKKIEQTALTNKKTSRSIYRSLKKAIANEIMSDLSLFNQYEEDMDRLNGQLKKIHKLICLDQDAQAVIESMLFQSSGCNVSSTERVLERYQPQVKFIKFQFDNVNQSDQNNQSINHEKNWTRDMKIMILSTMKQSHKMQCFQFFLVDLSTQEFAYFDQVKNVAPFINGDTLQPMIIQNLQSNGNLCKISQEDIIQQQQKFADTVKIINQNSWIYSRLSDNSGPNILNHKSISNSSIPYHMIINEELENRIGSIQLIEENSRQSLKYESSQPQQVLSFDISIEQSYEANPVEWQNKAFLRAQLLRQKNSHNKNQVSLKKEEQQAMYRKDKYHRLRWSSYPQNQSNKHLSSGLCNSCIVKLFNNQANFPGRKPEKFNSPSSKSLFLIAKDFNGKQQTTCNQQCQKDLNLNLQNGNQNQQQLVIPVVDFQFIKRCASFDMNLNEQQERKRQQRLSQHQGTMNNDLYSHLVYDKNSPQYRKFKSLWLSSEHNQNNAIFDKEQVEILQKKSSNNNIFQDFKGEIEANKRYMNLVVHDLRNPSEAINQGLTDARDLLQIQTNQIISKINSDIRSKLRHLKQQDKQYPRKVILNNQKIQQKVNKIYDVFHNSSVDSQIEEQDVEQILQESKSLSNEIMSRELCKNEVDQIHSQRLNKQQQLHSVVQESQSVSEEQDSDESLNKKKQSQQEHQSIQNECKNPLENVQSNSLDESKEQSELKNSNQDAHGNGPLENQINLRNINSYIGELRNQVNAFSQVEDQLPQQSLEEQQMLNDQDAQHIKLMDLIKQIMDEEMEEPEQDLLIQEAEANCDLQDDMVDEFAAQIPANQVNLRQDQQLSNQIEEQNIEQLRVRPQHHQFFNMIPQCKIKKGHDVFNRGIERDEREDKLLAEFKRKLQKDESQSAVEMTLKLSKQTQTQIIPQDFYQSQKQINFILSLMRQDLFKQFLQDYYFYTIIINKIEIEQKKLQMSDNERSQPKEKIQNIRDFVVKCFTQNLLSSNDVLLGQSGQGLNDRGGGNNLNDSVVNPIHQNRSNVHQSMIQFNQPQLQIHMRNYSRDEAFINNAQQRLQEVQAQMNIQNLVSPSNEQILNSLRGNEHEEKKLSLYPIDESIQEQDDYNGQSSSQNVINRIDSNNRINCKECPILRSTIYLLLNNITKLLKGTLMTQNYLNIAQSSSVMIQTLIDDLLDLAKIQKGAFTVNYECINLLSLITEAFHTIQFKAEQKEIKLMLELDAKKPFLFEKVYCDKRRMMQILLNFLSNSIKFTSKNGFIKIHLHVIEEQTVNDCISEKMPGNDKPKSKRNFIDLSELMSKDHSMSMNQRRTKDRNQHFNNKETQSQRGIYMKENLKTNTVNVEKFIKIHLTVEDNGCGISDVSEIFQDFKMLNEHKKMNPNGTGLGLQICKNLIEQMGGKVNVESKPQKGTKFIIELNPKVIDLASSEDNMQIQINLPYIKQPDFLKHFNPLGVDSSRINSEEMQQISDSKIISQSSQIINTYMYKTIKEQGQMMKIEDNFKIIQKLQKLVCSNDVNLSDLDKIHEDEEDMMINVDKVFQKAPKTAQSLIVEKKVPIKSQPRRMISIRHSSHVIFTEPSEQQDDLRNFISFGLNSMGDCSNYEKQMQLLVKKAVKLQCKHKHRKINVLVANDEPFQLMIITTTLLRKDFIMKVDQAHNGQEALDFVKKNEILRDSDNVGLSELTYYYDLILLDLNMQIMDGYNACTQIRQHYELLNRGREINSNHGNQQLLQDLVPFNYSVQNQNQILLFRNINEHLGVMEMYNEDASQNLPGWFNDIVSIQKIYNDISAVGSNLNYSSLIDDQNQFEQNLDELKKIYKQKIQKVFESLFFNVRYNTLAKLKCPLIYALSSTVDRREIMRTGEVGFIGFIQQPLSISKINQIKNEMMDTFSNTWIQILMKNMGISTTCIDHLLQHSYDEERQDGRNNNQMNNLQLFSQTNNEQ